MKVRFVSGREGATLAVRDAEYSSKREAIAAIRGAGFRPGVKIIEKGQTIRLAYDWTAKKQ